MCLPLMFRRDKPSDSNQLECSFCHKRQDKVAKLISSPSDYPRAYICDECIEVCQAILDDERGGTPPRITLEFADAVRRWLAGPIEDRPAMEELRRRAEEIFGSAI